MAKKQKISGGVSFLEVGKDLLAHAKNMIPRLVIVVLLAGASAFLTIIGPDYVSQITQYITDGLASTIDLAGVARVGSFLVGVYGLAAIFGFFQNRLAATVTLRVSNQLRNEISQKINRVPMPLFHRMSSGDILSRMTNDVQMLSQTLSNSIPTIVAAVAQFVGCLVMMFTTEWRMKSGGHCCHGAWILADGSDHRFFSEILRGAADRTGQSQWLCRGDVLRHSVMPDLPGRDAGASGIP